MIKYRKPFTELSYPGVHKRTRDLFGAARNHSCVLCSKKADDWAYDGTDSSEKTEKGIAYSVYPEFYFPACRSCHVRFDAEKSRKRRTHCVRGHGMTEDNIYVAPKRPTGMECLECRNLANARRYKKEEN